MVRYFAIFLALAIFTLFYPYRDLYVREDTFSSAFVLVGKGYWTLDACREAAQAQAAEDYQCRKRTVFGSMLSTSTQYSQGDQGVDVLE